MAEVTFDRSRALKTLMHHCVAGVEDLEICLDALASCYSISDAPNPLPAGSERACDVCGQPVVPSSMLDLCREHLDEFLAWQKRKLQSGVAAGYVEEIK